MTILCSMHQIGERISLENALWVPCEEFEGLFSIKPVIDGPKLELGIVYVNWVRNSKRGEKQHITPIATTQKLSDNRLLFRWSALCMLF